MALEEPASSCLLLLVSEKGGGEQACSCQLSCSRRGWGAKMEFPSARQGSESNAASLDVPERLQAIDALVRTC